MIAMDWTPIIVAALTAVASFAGVYYSNRKAAGLIEYRLGQLEHKVDRHNQVIERTYHLEEQNALQEAELKRLNKRLEIVEERR